MRVGSCLHFTCADASTRGGGLHAVARWPPQTEPLHFINHLVGCLGFSIARHHAVVPTFSALAQVDAEDEDDEGFGARRATGTRRGGIVLSDDED